MIAALRQIGKKIAQALWAPVRKGPVFFLLVLILCYPLFVPVVKGYLISGPERREFVLHFFGTAVVAAYALSAVASCFKSAWAKVLVVLPLLIVNAVDIFLTQNFGTRITPAMAAIVGETNVQESSEFVAAYLTSRGFVYAVASIVGAALALAGAAIADRWLSPRLTSKTMPGIVTACCLALACWQARYVLTIVNADSVDEILMIKGGFANCIRNADAVSNTLYTARAFGLQRSQVGRFIASTRHFVEHGQATCAGTDSLDVILVIGESYIRSHASLYGYPLATTPRMDQELSDGNLVAMDDAISYCFLTSETMKNVLSCNNQQQGEPWVNYPAFPAVFKKAGFEVLMWDNQVDNNNGNLWNFSMNSVIANPQIVNLCYSAMNEHNYEFDGELVDDWTRVAAQSKVPRRLSILHLRGQHIKYDERYPHDTHTYFTPDSVKRNEPWLTAEARQAIAHYDNATRYNDWLMGRVMDMYRGRNAVIVYFSDHGEEVYDYRNSMGRQAPTPGKERERIECLYRIPFVVWCSPQYQQRHPDVMSHLAAASRQPITNDVVSNILFDLAGISTPCYRPAEDPLNPHFLPIKRRIDTQPYD